MAEHKEKWGRQVITSLAVAVKMWPAQRTTDMASSRQTLTTWGDGQPTFKPVDLNPAFCEWLMGLPIGWTDCTSSVMRSYPWWQLKHSYALRYALKERNAFDNQACGNCSCD
jgi:hypothetical protein